MTPREVIEKAVEAWNSNDRGTWMKFCSPGSEATDESGQETWAGQMWETLHEAFPDSRFQLQQTIEEGEYIAFVNRFTGTHTGTYRTSDRSLAPTGELAPTGKHFEFEHGEFGHVRGDKVISLRGFGSLEGFRMLHNGPATA